MRLLSTTNQMTYFPKYMWLHHLLVIGIGIPISLSIWKKVSHPQYINITKSLYNPKVKVGTLYQISVFWMGLPMAHGLMWFLWQQIYRFPHYCSFKCFECHEKRHTGGDWIMMLHACHPHPRSAVSWPNLRNGCKKFASWNGCLSGESSNK